MAILSSGLAFPEQKAYLLNAKIGIFLASLATGITGIFPLRPAKGKDWRENYASDTV